MKHRRRHLGLLRMGVAFFLLSLIACTSKKNEVENVLRVSIKDDVKTLDPANVYDSVGAEILPNIDDTFYQFKYLEDQWVLEPLLAESMPEVSSDGLTLTIHLKRGILFQDDPCFVANGSRGRELKMKDFEFAFKRLAIPSLQSQGAWIFDGKLVGFNEFKKMLNASKGEEYKKVFENGISGIHLKDDYTMELKLIKPYPVIPYLFSMTFTSPVPKEAIEMYGDQDGNLKDHPVGTGPFMLKSWELNQKIELVKNPNFKGVYPGTSGSEKLKAAGFLADAGKPLPFLDGLIFEVIPEESVRLQKLEKGEIDLTELTKDTFRASMADATHLHEHLMKKGMVAEYENSPVMNWVAFNLADQTLQNKYLRQALSSAINREQWIEEFDKYKGEKQTEVCPPGLMDRAETGSIKYDFNLEKANELLKKAGYPQGKGLPVLTMDFRGMENQFAEMGEFFVKQFGAIGVKIKVIRNTFPDYLEKTKQGNLQIFLRSQTLDYPDVENGYQLLYGLNKAPGPNDSNWVNEEYDSLYQKMAMLPVGAKERQASVKKMEALIQEEVPWAYGYYRKTYRIRQGYVKNFRVSDMIQNKYKYMKIEAH